MKQYMAWKEENPDWDKDWQAGCASAGEVGDWRDKMSKTHPGWKDNVKSKRASWLRELNQTQRRLSVVNYG